MDGGGEAGGGRVFIHVAWIQLCRDGRVMADGSQGGEGGLIEHRTLMQYDARQAVRVGQYRAMRFRERDRPELHAPAFIAGPSCPPDRHDLRQSR